MPKKYTNCKLLINSHFFQTKRPLPPLEDPSKRKSLSTSKYRAASDPTADKNFLLRPLTCRVFRLRLIGTYGLKKKREVWRLQLTLAKLR